MAAERWFVLGTAGHVDHGKTSLVGALTGVETDRWAEEKERGITIDLGFAPLPLGDGLRAAVVDVPGHEGLVRNMLAGATGLDAALIVVAADEGPMPQTLEHLAILDLMNVERAVVALTKVDLAEAEWVDLVEDEVQGLLASTALAGAEIVRTSVRSGEGLDQVRDALAAVAPQGEPKGQADVFRLPVDRAFSVRGTGTVITGSIWSGRVARGDDIRVLPEGHSARVRRVHVFGEEVEEAGPGMRAALALTGLERVQVPRGSTLTGSKEWEPSTRFTASLRALPNWGKTPTGRRVRIHLGTGETMARVYPVGGDAAEGALTFAEIRPEGPVVIRGGDRFVVRSYSPVTTIGGGTVLEPHPPRRRMRRADAAEFATVGGGVEGRVLHAVRMSGDTGVGEAALPLLAGCALPVLDELLQRRPDALERVGPRVYAAERRALLASTLMAELDEVHRSAPMRPGGSLEHLRPSDAERRPLWNAVVDDLQAQGEIAVQAGWMSRAGFEPSPSPAQQPVVRRLADRLQELGLQAPRSEELGVLVDSAGDVQEYIEYLVLTGRAVRLPEDLVVDADTLTRAVEEVRSELGGRSALGPADFRGVLPVPRRQLMPLLAHLDSMGVTVRRGQTRDVP